jgi:hypothetical protein
MRNALADDERGAGRHLHAFFAIGELPRAFENDEAFLFVIMNVHWCTVAVVCEDLEDGIGTVRFIGGYAYGKTLSGGNFYPFGAALIKIGGNCLVRHDAHTFKRIIDKGAGKDQRPRSDRD